MTLVIQNVKKSDLSSIQATTKDKFNTLKNATFMLFSKDNFSLVFTADFYLAKKNTIQTELT